jgi:hypothetical protein
MSEELRQVRDTLIEALRHSETLTLEGRALFRRYAAMSDAVTGTAEVPAPVQAGPVGAPPAVPAAPRRRPEPVEEEDEFGGSFMVRNNPTQPHIPGYRETPQPGPQTPADLPRSMRDRRR